MTKEDILQALREVHHPARQDRDIVDLGMVKDIEISAEKVSITLAFPKRRDPLTEYLVGSARAALIRHLPSSVQTEVKAVVVEDDKPAKKKGLGLGLEQIAEVRHIIGIASGKGGVGKSTVAVNLACALARMGYRVGLADADVYGPSVPVMTGTEGAVPAAEPGEEEGRELILPLEKYGVKWMSIGYFAERGQALIWRGPMACNALKQMILQVKWGPLDYLLIDMPPGTGDIHISLVQDIPMEGAVIVTTPQTVALADVEKGVNMFRNENVNRPIFGLVENMAWFTPEAHPDEKYYIFGQDGGAQMARELGVDLLGRIPLVQGIRESGDLGEPVALGSRPDGVAFLELAGKLAEKLG
ncbi:MAG: Mrp/NBP35 family ATP-binding protein [Bacteroidales bacterium]|nr:Mrp/NBP35 family ATP-binding protein [Bacteroidales bacterium]